MFRRGFWCVFVLGALCGCTRLKQGALKSGSSPQEECGKDIKYRMSARYKNQVKLCYDDLLINNSSAQGTLSLDLLVVYGTVVDVNFAKESTLKSKKMRSCVRKHAMEWTFTDRCEDLSIQLPFSFEPESGSSLLNTTLH